MRISDWSSDVCSSDLIGCQAHRYWSLLQPAHNVAQARVGSPRQGDDDLVHLVAADEADQVADRAQQRQALVGLCHARCPVVDEADQRSEEHTSELQSLMRI